MKQFLDKDFLLKTETAKILYHEYAKKMPIYDYHCHLNAKEIYEDRRFDSITDLWLVEGHAGDHYKWRAMRNNGIEEKYITGNASKKDKFLKWAETIPYTVGNPLYHWSHLELKNYFGIEEPFSPKNAEKIYDHMNEVLKTKTVRKIIEESNVYSLCTTDDPIDDLKWHKLLKEDTSFKTKVYPSFRPDKILNIDWDTFLPYVAKLNEVLGYEIKNLLIDGQLVDAQTIYTFNDVESDHSIGAVYSRKIKSLNVIGIEFDAYYEDGFDGERTTEEIKFGIAQIDYYDSSTNGFKDIFTFVNRFVPGDGSVSGHCSYGQLSGVTYHHDIEFSQDGKYGQLSLMAYLSDSMNYGTACALFINLDELNSEDNYHDDVYRLPVHLFSENVVINAESANNVVISNLELICEANY